MSSDADIIQAWTDAVALFNSGSYWQAHEKLEHKWRQLPPSEKLYIQVLIQTCAILFHLEKQRFAPARNLCQSVVEKLSRLCGGTSSLLPDFRPRPHIDGLAKSIEDIRNHLERDDFGGSTEALFKRAQKLRARWLN